MEGEDLPLAVGQEQVAVHHPLDQEAALMRGLPLMEEILAWLQLPDPQGQGEENLPIRFRQHSDAVELADQHRCVGLHGA
jgi:hypothetical protein